MPEEKLYVGCKLIKAYPDMKDGKSGYHVTYADGYESWSPKDVFERAYREVTEPEKEFVSS